MNKLNCVGSATTELVYSSTVYSLVQHRLPLVQLILRHRCTINSLTSSSTTSVIRRCILHAFNFDCFSHVPERNQLRNQNALSIMTITSRDCVYMTLLLTLNLLIRIMTTLHTKNNQLVCCSVTNTLCIIISVSIGQLLNLS